MILQGNIFPENIKNMYRADYNYPFPIYYRFLPAVHGTEEYIFLSEIISSFQKNIFFQNTNSPCPIQVDPAQGLLEKVCFQKVLSIKSEKKYLKPFGSYSFKRFFLQLKPSSSNIRSFYFYVKIMSFFKVLYYN